LARHWASAVAWLGLEVKVQLVRAGFYPAGGGELRAEVSPWRESGALRLEARGALLAVRGLSGAGRLRGEVARRQCDAAQNRLWEERRIEADWEVQDTAPAASPGSFLLLEAVFEAGRAAFCFLGERRLPAERLGDRAARRLLRFLEEDEGAVDPHLADQLALPMALRAGGRVTTCEVTSHLETVAEVLSLFGVPARTLGRRGGPGALEVERH
jgi:RNA 3'-terminal phosphate cyclase (ATP)